MEKTSLYVSDCHGATVVSLTVFLISKSGLTVGIVIYAGSCIILTPLYRISHIFSIRPADIFASICVTISISDGTGILAGSGPSVI